MKSIYFIRPIGMTGPIKVGFSGDPQGRAANCTAKSPYPLEVAAQIAVPDDGTRHRAAIQLERRFHDRYALSRLHGEWFAASAVILSDIAAINAGTFSLDRLESDQTKAAA